MKNARTTMILSATLVVGSSALAQEQEPLWADLDGDGLDELVALTPGRPDVVLRNLGDGTFVDATTELGLGDCVSCEVLLEDVDGDGRVEVLRVTDAGELRLHRSTAPGVYLDVSADTGLGDVRGATGARFFDYDRDGRLDLVVAAEGEPSRLFHGLDGLAFEPVVLALPEPVAAVQTPSLGVEAVVEADLPEQLNEDRNGKLGKRRAALPPDVGLPGRLPVFNPPPIVGDVEEIERPFCSPSLQNQAAPQDCLLASTVPTLGMLYPLSTELFIGPGSGYVGIGTLQPTERLEVIGNARIVGDVIAGTSLNVNGADAFIGGGANHTIHGDFCVIGGGDRNTAGLDGPGSPESYATVGGGFMNEAIADGTTVSGGIANEAFDNLSSVGGGGGNLALATASTVGGGSQNSANDVYATVSGGQVNLAQGQASAIGGGASNEADADYSTIGGGEDNMVSPAAFNATISGGRLNQANAQSTTVGGGSLNDASGNSATIAGGTNNTVVGNSGTVGGGVQNTAGAQSATVSGGSENTASGVSSTVAGGLQNTASGNNATVSGGILNTALAFAATVGGGSLNSAQGAAATVAGGQFNAAGGDHSTVPGGSNNSAGGQFAFAAGADAGADHDGTFVWSSGAGAFDSTGVNQFLVDASGGIGLNTNAPLASAHVEGTDIGASIIQAAAATGLFVEDTDAVLTLASEEQGIVGSVVSMPHFAAGLFQDQWSIYRGTATSGSNLRISYGTSGNWASNPAFLNLAPNGNVGVGNNTPSERLHVNGNVLAANYLLTSDARLKEDVQELDGSLEKLRALRGVSFAWDAEQLPEAEAERQLGFLAQEVREVLPELVREDENGRLSVAYTQVVPLLVEALKEQDDELSALRRELAELRERLP